MESGRLSEIRTYDITDLEGAVTLLKLNVRWESRFLTVVLLWQALVRSLSTVVRRVKAEITTYYCVRPE